MRLPLATNGKQLCRTNVDNFVNNSWEREKDKAREEERARGKEEGSEQREENRIIQMSDFLETSYSIVYNVFVVSCHST